LQPARAPGAPLSPPRHSSCAGALQAALRAPPAELDGRAAAFADAVANALVADSRRSAYHHVVSYCSQVTVDAPTGAVCGVVRALVAAGAGAETALTVLLRSVERGDRLRDQGLADGAPARGAAPGDVLDAAATLRHAVEHGDTGVVCEQLVDTFAGLTSDGVRAAAASASAGDAGADDAFATAAERTDAAVLALMRRVLVGGHSARAASLALKYRLPPPPPALPQWPGAARDVLEGVCAGGHLPLAEEVATRLFPRDAVPAALGRVLTEAHRRGKFAVASRLERLKAAVAAAAGEGAAAPVADGSGSRSARTPAPPTATAAPPGSAAAAAVTLPMARHSTVPATATISAVNAVAVAMTSQVVAHPPGAAAPAAAAHQPGDVTLRAPFVFPDEVLAVFDRGSTSGSSDEHGVNVAATFVAGATSAAASAAPPTAYPRLYTPGPTARAHARALGPVIAKTHREPGREEAERTAANVAPEAAHRRSVSHLLTAGRLDVALTYVGTDPALQSHLVRELVGGRYFGAARAALKALAAANAARAAEAGGVAVNASFDADADADAVAVGVGGGAVSLEDIDASEAAATRSPCARGGAAAADGPEEAAAAATAIAIGGHWQVPLQFDDDAPAAGAVDAYQVTVVDGVGPLQELRATLEDALAAAGDSGGGGVLVGVDAEWRPDGLFDSRGLPPPAVGAPPQRWPVSVLQLCVGRRVFLVDALALRLVAAGDSGSSNDDDDGAVAVADAAAATLRWLLGHPLLVKVGWGVEGDVRKLAWSYPGLLSGGDGAPAGALAAAAACVDLADMMRWRAAAVGSNSGAHRHYHAPHSLSAAVQAVTGRALRKTQQVSDWQQRPLTRAQQAYAALDAVAVVEVFAAVTGGGTDAAEAEAPLQALRRQDGLIRDVVMPPPPAEPSPAAPAERPAWLYAPYRGVGDDAAVAAAPQTAAGPPAPPLTDPPLGPAHVAAVLASLGLNPTQRLLHSPGSSTAEAAALALGVDARHIIKTLAVVVEAAPPRHDAGAGSGHVAAAVVTPVVVLVPGDCRADLRAVAAALDAPRHAVRLARVDECVRLFGYTPGTFPPIGHLAPLHTLVHAGLRERAHAGGGGGLASAASEAQLPLQQLSLSSASAASASAASSSAAPPPPPPPPSHGFLYGGGGSLAHSVALSWDELLSCAQRLGQVVTVAQLAVEDSASSGGRAGGAPQPPPPPPLPLPLPLGQPTPLAAVTADTPLTIDRPRFICDGMLGRLTRWLRVVGVDCEGADGAAAAEFAAVQLAAASASTDTAAAAAAALPVPSPRWRQQLSQEQLMAWADASGRVLLTRDRKLLGRKPGGPWCGLRYLTDNETLHQFTAVSEHFGLTVTPESLMSRCAKCNGLGYVLISKEEAAAADIPAKVLAKIDEFWRCRNPRCRQVYWTGSKFESTRDAFMGLFAPSSAAAVATVAPPLAACSAAAGGGGQPPAQLTAPAPL
jgi:uncharacterized protein with PIN domain/prolyl-tRNA editing enzyme YbaK/EbsC (Cys-tRNA(Pro) deacylase)